MNIADKDIIYLLQTSFDRIKDGFQDKNSIRGSMLIRDGLNDLDTILYLLKKAAQ